MKDMVHVGILNRLAFDETGARFLLGQAVSVIEDLIATGADSMAVDAGEKLLADYRKWIEEES